MSRLDQNFKWKETVANPILKGVIVATGLSFVAPFPNHVATPIFRGVSVAPGQCFVALLVSLHMRSTSRQKQKYITTVAQKRKLNFYTLDDFL